MAKGTTGAPTIADSLAAAAIERARTEGRMPEGVGPQTTPSRIRWLAFGSLVLLVVLFVSASVAIGHAREGLRVIGHGAGPKVAATADLYFALGDMDAQVANILLNQDRDSARTDPGDALETYEQRRAEASRALLQAAQLAEGDAAEERNVRAVIEGLGAYEGLVAEARRLSRDGDGGDPSDEVIELHRQATDLMRMELLPKAYNLTLDSGATVRRAYEEQRTAMLTGLMWVVAAGLGTTGVLGALHRYISVRFRRRISPAVALSAGGALTLTVFVSALLATQVEHLRVAKEEGLDSVLALSRARAISTSIHADQSRFLLDPGRADTYEQVYLEGSQAVLYVDEPPRDGAGADEASGIPVDLGEYHARVGRVVREYPDATGSMYGFLGEEARDLGGDSGGAEEEKAAALERVLRAYRDFQDADRDMRALASGSDSDPDEVVAKRMGAVEESFAEYDAALVDLTRMHHETFDSAVGAGDRALRGWNLILPAGCVLVAVLLLGGVYPRLAEYR